jgi:hypothetical protein
LFACLSANFQIVLSTTLDPVIAAGALVLPSSLYTILKVGLSHSWSNSESVALVLWVGPISPFHGDLLLVECLDQYNAMIAVAK